jgi:signal transduction histidine kinase/DNA-binding response OmpR family regulator
VVYLVFVTLAPFALAVVAAVGVGAWRRLDRPVGRALAVLSVCEGGWIATSAAQILAPSQEATLALSVGMYAWMAATVLAWLAFALTYADRWSPLAKGLLAAYVVESVVFVALVATNDRHGLIWTEVTSVRGGPFQAARLSFGPVLYAQATLAWAAIGVSLALVLQTFARAAPPVRRLSRWVAAVVLVPVVLNVLYMFGIWAPGKDFSGIALGVASGVVGLGVFRDRLLDLRPIARDALVENIPEGMVVLDDRGRIADANPVARRCLAGGGALVGRRAADALPTPLYQAIAEGRGASHQDVEVSTNGRTRYFDVTVSNLPGEAGRVALLLDVSDRRAQAEALREADELKTRFLAHISHEFRTPLTLTFGPLDDFLDGEYASVEEARPHIARARRNGGRLLRLINQLLDLSRLGAGAFRLSPAPQPRDLAEHVRGLTALFVGHAEASGVALRTAIAAGAWTRTYDADLVEKVVVNLLSNALKFTPAGGVVTVTLQAEPPDVALLEVADTGVGISEVDRERVFDRFFQVEGDGTRQHEGSGVGLALVRELAELAGGTAGVESAPGEGSRFTVRLPGLAPAEVTPPVTVEMSALAPPAPAEGALPAVPEGDAPLVLVVEDNADMRAYVRARLEGAYRVAEARDGAEGLEAARELVPNAVVTDLMMPELDGLGLTAALKADRRTSHVPVVLLTARGEVADRVTGFEAGADAYLAKPFSAEELRARVAGLLRERDRLRQRYAAARPDAEARSERPADEAPPLPDAEAAFLAEFDALAEADLGDAGLTVDRLATDLGMSARQLQRKLSALTDETPGARLRRLRLERAAALLTEEGLSVKEASGTVGFQSESAFGRAFRQRYGVAPSEYAADAAVR